MYLHLRPSAVVVVFASALAAQVHVAPTGSDAAAGTAADPFRTIDHAAAVAANGSTIYLHAGSYGDEQGIVTLGTKDLVLQGAGVAATILHLHTTATVALAPADAAFSILLPHRVGVLVTGPARVFLRDLAIVGDGTAPGSGQLAGLYANGGADVVCDHVVIQDCRGASYATGRSYAIVARGDAPTDATTVFVRDGVFTGFGSGAMRAMLRAEVELQECEVHGAGTATGGFDQVGIHIEQDARGVVQHSRLTEFGGPGGAAVRLRQATTGCVVEGNRIRGAAFGIDIARTTPAIVPGSLRNNRIAAVDTTIRVAGTAGLAITANGLFPVSRYDAVPFWDDSTAGNSWQGNRYAIAPGTASVAIPGGANVDTSPAVGASELRPGSRVACVGAPVAVVAADLDGDGRDDFATLDLRTAGVGLSVGLWRPTGHVVTGLGFGGSSLRPIALVAGQFDGAPGTDLIALTAPLPPATAGAAFWVFGNDGLGGFTLLHQRNRPGYIAPAGLAAARLNGDGLDDLVVVDRGAMPWVAGRGDAFVDAFGGVNWNPAPLPATFVDALTAVATGDVDGDGFADVVATEGGPGLGRLHWWRGNGLGALAAGPGSPFTTAVNPGGVAIADFDGDADRDVLVAAANGSLPLQRGVVQVFASQAGVLGLARQVPTDAGPTRIVVADLDADTFPGTNRPDLVVLDAAAGALSLATAFTATSGYAGGGLTTAASNPADFAATDLDGDPYRDVVVAEPDQFGVLLLHGSPSAAVATFARGCPGTAGREPRLGTLGAPGMPVQPNATLAFGVYDAYPLSLAVVAVALGPGLPFPCGYVLDAPLFLLTVPLDATGRGVLSLPLPPTPDAHGLPFCLQGGVFDFAATTSFLPNFSLTAGLCLRIGD